MNEVNLLGVDVGFSAKSKTTGLAWRVSGYIDATLVGTDWPSRSTALPPGVTFNLAALDAPVVPERHGDAPRSCEATFNGNPFWNRCRPGLSHHGRGLKLRHAGSEAVRQFAAVTDPEKIIEAFPNAFLGVLLSEGDYLNSNPDGRKSDWLYQRAIDSGQLQMIMGALGWTTEEDIARIKGERDHDCRAALICLMTAGFAAAGTATVIGDDEGGWFWLPPIELWAPWAWEGLTPALNRVRKKHFPKLRLRDCPEIKNNGKTTDQGYVNKHGQMVIRKTTNPGSDHNQLIYVLRCLKCDAEYGANGSDIHSRRCPRHQDGAPGLEF